MTLAAQQTDVWDKRFLVTAGNEAITIKMLGAEKCPQYSNLPFLRRVILPAIFIENKYMGVLPLTLNDHAPYGLFQAPHAAALHAALFEQP